MLYYTARSAPEKAHQGLAALISGDERPAIRREAILQLHRRLEGRYPLTIWCGGGGLNSVTIIGRFYSLIENAPTKISPAARQVDTPRRLPLKPVLSRLMGWVGTSTKSCTPGNLVSSRIAPGICCRRDTFYITK